jgi:4-amino-4-deoxy-L-arabinose transferase-like glycosyltransferase
VGLIAAAAVLGGVGLDHTYLWDDESLVGIIASNLLKTGHLTGWDGRNLLAFRNGALLDDNLRPINSPLDFYVAAGSMALLGKSTFAVRLPFLLAGLAALGVFWRLVRRELPTGPAGLYALALLALSPAYLLNIRQCRYYALAALLPVAMFWAYRRCLDRGRLRYFLLLGVLTALLFYANYLLAVFAVALAAYHLIFHRHSWPLRQLWKPAAAAALAAAGTAPYTLVYHAWRRPDVVPDQIPWLTHHGILLWRNLLGLNFQTYLPWMLALLGLVLILILRRRRPVGTAEGGPATLVRPAVQWATLGLLYVVLLSAASYQPLVKGIDTADVRYLIPAAPFFAGFCGAVLGMLHGLHRLWGRLAAGALLALAVCTTALTAGLPSSKVAWLLPAYVKEISHPYPTSYSKACDFLELHAQRDDVVLAIPDFCNYPLMFYQGDRVRMGCLLNENTHLPAQKIRQLHAPLQGGENFPDWLIAFGAQPELKQYMDFFSRPHQGLNGPTRYQYRLVQRLDTVWLDQSRPELETHSFGPFKDYDPRTQAVYVYQKTP